MKNDDEGGVAKFSLVEPSGPFDVAPGAEQLVRVRLTLAVPTNEAAVNIVWLCQTARGNEASFPDCIVIKQQESEPNWEALIADPPYSLIQFEAENVYLVVTRYCEH